MPERFYERSCLRYAHTTGFTSVIFTQDGESMVTCGSDGDIRCWTGIDDDDPSSTCLGEFVVCLVQKKDSSSNVLLASTDRNTVQAYTYPDIENNGILFRFTAPATCISVRGEIVAAGSEDTSIKVRCNDGQTPIDLEGHEGPILALDIHPERHLLASVAGDGLLKIWNIKEGGEGEQQSKLLRTVDSSLYKANSYENSICFGTLCFEPSHGGTLAYIKEKQVLLINTSTWEQEGSLSDSKIQGKLTCCKYSKDGRFLAIGSDKGEITIFDVGTRRTVKCEPAARECHGITCLAWCPKNNDELAYCDSTGQLGTMFLRINTIGVHNEGNIVEDLEAEANLEDIDFVDDEDTRASSTSVKRAGDEEDDNGDDDDEDDDGVSLEKLKSRVMSFVQDGKEDDIETEEESRDRDQTRSPSASRRTALSPSTFRAQGPFQPGSTPVHLEHRYLTWNQIGIVTLHADTSGGSIDVEFHDASVHHTLHIPNYSNHNMASLSETVLALAEAGTSKLVCIALATGGNKEWSFQLPDCEGIDALVATNRLVAVTTSAHFLRLFTVLGTQREIISLPASVVCLAGYEDRLLVCHHASPPGTQQQHLAGMLLQTSGLHLKSQNIQVALPPERQLIWLGFSDVGSPVILDSMGLIQLFSLKSNCWHPICDTMKLSSSVTNRYFVVSISERSQIIQAVLCRGTSYPMTTPRPMVQELPMQLPLCDLDSEKSTIEDALLRACLMDVQNAEKTIKENAMKLFALACRSELEPRAKEIIETIACPDLLALAVKYASKLGRIHLSDRLAELSTRIDELHQKNNAESPLIDQTVPYSSASIQMRAAQLHAFDESNTSSSASASSGTKLAPKVMGSNSVRKSTLKRLTFNTPQNSPFSKTMPGSSGGSSLSQESTESNLPSILVQRPSHSSPGNTLNPFAAKRKIGEVEQNIVMGTDKLKMVKKS